MDTRKIQARIENELGTSLGQEPKPTLHPPPRVADHELIRRIGAGSYGEVWLARAVTGQWRAVKAVSRDRFSSERPYEREFRGVVQFEPISRSHAGLVQVLHVGRDDEAGAFYYVMELADACGNVVRRPVNSEPVSAAAPEPLLTHSLITDYCPRTLRSDLTTRRRLPVSEAVALGVELTGALGHIHRHGLVHRDVKPSNVIFVQGRPKLADLGLVTSPSEARTFVGTEGFIPPEGPGTVKADLFALGRLLYEAVTGKDRCDFPELPSDLDAWPNREEFLEFNEVITRLCAPDPERRYANAAEVAGDLNLILAGRSVRRANGIERRLEQARRITAMTLAGLALFMALAWFLQKRHHDAENRAAQERSLRERAENAERDGHQQLYTALLEQARATVRGGELGQRVKALDAVRRAAAITNTPELRREALTALALPDARWQRDLPFGPEFTGKEPDPAFERIAVCRGRGPVEVRAISNLAVLATLPASTNLLCYVQQWSADGRFLAVKRDYPANDKADLEAWDLRGTPRRALLVHGARYNAWAFHPQRAELLVAIGSDLVANYDLEQGTELARLALEVTPQHLKYSPDGKNLAASYRRDDGWGVSVHEVGRTEAQASHVFDLNIGAIEWHPRGRWLAITDFRGAVHLMDPATGELRLLGRHRAEAVDAVFDPRGEYLLTGGWERSLIVWDLRTRQRAFSIERGSWLPRFKSDGTGLIAVREANLEMFAFERPETVRELPLPSPARTRHAAFSPDGRWVALSTDRGVTVCDLAGGQSVSTDSGDPRLFWNDESTELFGSGSSSGNGGGGAHRWRVRAGQGASAPPTLQPLPITRPAGFNSLSVVSNRVVWTAAGGSRITTLENLQPPEVPWHATLRGINGQSPDGRWLAIFVANSPYLHLYEMPGLKRVTVITNQPRISGFSFSPSSRELAVVSRGHAEFFRTGTWEHTRGATNVVGIAYTGCLYQPDEQGVWLAQDLRFAGLHDARTFVPLLPLPAGHHPQAVSADGRQLVVSEEGRHALVWDLALVRQQLHELGLDWSEERATASATKNQ